MVCTCWAAFWPWFLLGEKCDSMTTPGAECVLKYFQFIGISWAFSGCGCWRYCSHDSRLERWRVPVWHRQQEAGDVVVSGFRFNHLWRTAHVLHVRARREPE